MSETMATLKNRRSCRNYKSDMFPENLLEQIIEAGTYAAEPEKPAAPRKENYVYYIK